MTRPLTAIFGGILVSLALAACSPQLEVTVVTSPPASEPVTATTYAWITDDLLIMEGEPNALRTERNEKRLRTAIDLAMQGKGYTTVARTEADLLVAFSVGTDVRYRIEGGDSDLGVTTMSPTEPWTKGTANVYLYDRASGELIWHSSIWKWIAKGGEKDEVLNEGAKAMLAEFPAATTAAAPAE